MTGGILPAATGAKNDAERGNASYGVAVSRPRPKSHRRPFRLRWILYALTIAATLVWLGSAKYRLQATPGTRHQLRLEGGRLHYVYREDTPFPETWGLTYARPPFGLAPDWHVYPSSWFVRVPLWIPVVLLGAAAIRVWWRDMRWRTIPGHCARCGYALEGLEGETVTCPECGHEQVRTA